MWTITYKTTLLASRIYARVNFIATRYSSSLLSMDENHILMEAEVFRHDQALARKPGSWTTGGLCRSLRGSVNRRVANVTTVGQEAIQSFGELSGKKSSQPIDGSSKST